MITHTFRDPALLAEALTHPALTNETGHRNYERLEFLGDAVVQLVATDILFDLHPDKAEGDLTAARQRLVDEPSLAAISRRIGLPGLLRVPPAQPEIREKSKVASRVFEAVAGAIYRDAGLDAARAWLEPLLREQVRLTPAAARDPKSLLHEWTDAHGHAYPEFTCISEGPAHALVWTATVKVAGRVYGPATGVDKRAASKAVAQLALLALESEDAAPR